MRLIVRLSLFASLIMAIPGTVRSAELPLAVQRQQFLLAEQAISDNRDTDYLALAPTLKTYPLYPYLQYQWLKNHLDADEKISQFLREHTTSRYAAALRQKWLLQLGRKQSWNQLLAHYQGSDDSEVQCFFGRAQVEAGQTLEAFNLARNLWLSGKSAPEACDALFNWFKASPYFNQEMLKERFHAALKRDNQTLASYMTSFFSGSDLDLLNTWLLLHRQPDTITRDGHWRQFQEQAGALFAHAIDRWLESDLDQALAVWDKEKSQLTIPSSLAATTEKRLAMALALKHDSRAYARLSQLQDHDESSREWRVRAALNGQNWHDVAQAIEGLSAEEKSRDKWQYWQARCLAETDQTAAATKLYEELAKNRSFYGFLAAGRLGRGIDLADKPLEIPQQELASLKAHIDFQVASELLVLGRQAEVKRQWAYAVSKLDSRLLPAAAKLAQEWHQPALAISTIAKANQWDDVNLRFPLEYVPQIQTNASLNQLDPALLLGLIRQESAFDDAADSPAGAKGLMQVMPKTGQQIAAELHDSWQNDLDLFKSETNLKYGAYYFKTLLQQFSGHIPLATAAYNAGPNKVKRWLPQHRATPADIWIENIPYKETRGYVTSVLMYSLIYQQRLGRDSLQINSLLREVAPG